MLITFKSKAAAEVVMYKEHAKRILDLLNKDINRGVITASESAAALARLDAEIAESRLHPVSDEVQHDLDAHPGDRQDEHEAVEVVSFATRAYPFQEMLRAAQKGGHDIAWGI